MLLLLLLLQVMQAIGKELSATDRGEAMKLMHEAAPVFLRTLHRTLPFHGIVGLGGSGTQQRTADTTHRTHRTQVAQR